MHSVRLRRSPSRDGPGEWSLGCVGTVLRGACASQCGLKMLMPSRSGRARCFAIERAGTTVGWSARRHAGGVHRIRLGDGRGLAICVAGGKLLEVRWLTAEGLLLGVVAAVALILHVGRVVRRILGTSGSGTAWIGKPTTAMWLARRSGSQDEGWRRQLRWSGRL